MLIAQAFLVARKVKNQIQMTQIPSSRLPNGSIEMKIIEREWGIERCYISSNGEELCSPTPLSSYSWPFLSDSYET